MRIKPLNSRVQKQLKKYGIGERFNKQKRLFELNPAQPSLNTEKLEPKHVGFYSFRIDKQYRTIFRIRNNEAEILHVAKHYHK